MDSKKWTPCFCTLILGIAIIVFSWWTFSWSQILMTVLGALVVIKGLANGCCCGSGSSCCTTDNKET